MNENSDRIINYFMEKYKSPDIANIGLLKAVAFSSLFVKNIRYPLNIINVSETGQFKSRTSFELFNIFKKCYSESYENFNNEGIISLGSDITLNWLAENSDYGKKINNKMLLINDLTLAYSSKSNRSINRLLMGLAELISEGVYVYGDFRTNIKINARISLILNVTNIFFNHYRELIKENTFGDRMLIIFLNLSPDDLKKSSNSCKKDFFFKSPIKLKPVFVHYEKYLGLIQNFAEKYFFHNLGSLSRFSDKIISLLCGFACLNGRTEINDSDIDFLCNVEKYFFNPQMELLDFAIDLFLEGFNFYEIARLYVSSEKFKEKIVYDKLFVENVFNSFYVRMKRYFLGIEDKNFYRIHFLNEKVNQDILSFIEMENCEDVDFLRKRFNVSDVRIRNVLRIRKGS